MQPATMGVAIEVPDNDPYDPSAIGTVLTCQHARNFSYAMFGAPCILKGFLPGKHAEPNGFG